MKDQNISNPGDPDYFACTCSEENKKECNTLFDEVKSLLEAEDSNIVTKVIYSLNFDYNAKITSIDCDQWCAIFSQTLDMEKEGYKAIEPPMFTTYIQCDEVEHGIAATWLAYYKKYGLKRENN